MIGTNQDNVNDKIEKHGNSFGGDKNNNWLSLDIAKNIRKLYFDNQNLTYKQIGAIFGTSASQIHRVLTNAIWKDTKEN